MDLQPPAAKQRAAASNNVLHRKLATAALVQDSLKHLMETTEDKGTKGYDHTLLGGVTNWEAHAYSGQKKWKVS